MPTYRLKEMFLPLLIAMLTTLFTVGTLSLLLQTPVRQVSHANSLYIR
jgi:predicted RND superfamily exporter protein